MRDAYIVTSLRTPGCKKDKGAFKDTRPEDLLAFILKAVVDKTPNVTMNDIDDIMVGCAFPEAEQGLNIGRIASQIAGFPIEVSGATVNRFCSSGLEAIALSSLRIMAGWSEVAIGGGLDIKDIGLFEINEAFASQALYCIHELDIDGKKVNIHGGAIALGHPLGCTGAKLCATLLANMQRHDVKNGIESMCIGGGMGAAALFELCE